MLEDDRNHEPSGGSVHLHRSGGSYFQVVPVVLLNGEEKVETYAFLDNGSNITMVERSLMDSIRVKGPSQSLKLKWSSDVS